MLRVLFDDWPLWKTQPSEFACYWTRCNAINWYVALTSLEYVQKSIFRTCTLGTLRQKLSLYRLYGINDFGYLYFHFGFIVWVDLWTTVLVSLSLHFFKYFIAASHSLFLSCFLINAKQLKNRTLTTNQTFFHFEKFFPFKANVKRCIFTHF